MAIVLRKAPAGQISSLELTLPSYALESNAIKKSLPTQVTKSVAKIHFKDFYF